MDRHQKGWSLVPWPRARPGHNLRTGCSGSCLLAGAVKRAGATLAWATARGRWVPPQPLGPLRASGSPLEPAGESTGSQQCSTSAVASRLGTGQQWPAAASRAPARTRLPLLATHTRLEINKSQDGQASPVCQISPTYFLPPIAKPNCTSLSSLSSSRSRVSVRKSLVWPVLPPASLLCCS